MAASSCRCLGVITLVAIMQIVLVSPDYVTSNLSHRSPKQHTLITGILCDLQWFILNTKDFHSLHCIVIG